MHSFNVYLMKLHHIKATVSLAASRDISV